MFEFLKSKTFGIVASFIIGLGAIAVVVPRCTDASCKIVKAPNIDEVTKPVYQIGEKCYKFHPKTVGCPEDTAKVVEPFVRDSLL
jgi:hypothetical protein